MDIIITKPQKKMFLYVVVGVLVILILWGLVYLPSRKQMQGLQAQLDKVNEQLDKVKMIEEVQEAISTGYTYTQSIESLKGELAALSKDIATEEETSLEYLSSSARRLNLEVLSVKPASKEPLLDENKNLIKIADNDCFQLPVQLKLKGSYTAIGNYIESLRKDALSLIAVENLKINKFGKQDILNADVDLTIYLRSSK